MSKRKNPRRTTRGVGKHKEVKTRARILPVALVTLLFLILVAPLWRDSTAVRKLASLVSPPAVPPANQLTKEYIYAGDKLIATEEPGNLSAPENASALTLSNESPPRVTISWSPTQGAHHYEIERTDHVNVAYAPITTNVTGTTFIDSTVSSVHAYLYRIRAVDAGGNVSAYSNIDLATAISFTDDSLVVQSTLVKAAHINELRQAIDAVRWTANMNPASWGAGISQFSTTVEATHIDDLRTNLSAALSALNLPPCTYTDNSVTALRASFIKKEHIDQLRQCLR